MVRRDMTQYISTGFIQEKKPVERVSSRDSFLVGSSESTVIYKSRLMREVPGRSVGRKILNWLSDPLEIMA
jgi:hypothetical protein